jgi:hypothetical protein
MENPRGLAMQWYRRHTDRHSNRKLFAAGFMGGLVFDALCDLSAEYDLGGEIPPEHQDLDWLVRRMGLERGETEGVFHSFQRGENPNQGCGYLATLVQNGIAACLKKECGLLESVPLGDAGAAVWRIVGWDERQPKVPVKSTERVQAHRAKLQGRGSETDVKRKDGEKRVSSAFHTRSKSVPSPSPSLSLFKGVRGKNEGGEGAEDLQVLWNDAAHPDLPRWVELPEKRKVAARARLRERTLAEWRAILERISASSFCRGENDRGWKADPDWLLKPDTASKVLEGKYDNRAPKPNGAEESKTRFY